MNIADFQLPIADLSVYANFLANRQSAIGNWAIGNFFLCSLN
jgi:hypothetical protein